MHNADRTLHGKKCTIYIPGFLTYLALLSDVKERCKLLKLYSVGGRWMNEYGALVE